MSNQLHFLPVFVIMCKKQRIFLGKGVCIHMKLLSFIIPSYNCSAFLDKCVESMLCPEVLDQLDIIIVNDGSTDDTSAIAQSYCDRYPNSVRLINQQNKGHGGALNAGCAAAIGKYLKVIDADDWVETANLPTFLSALENCESDVVLTHHYTRNVSNSQTRNWKSYPKAFGSAMTMEQIMACPNDFFRSLTFHGITYRTDFYRREGITLSEHVFYEDQEYSTIPCCFAQTITCLDLFLYNYRIGDVNQSVSDANQLKRLSHSETVMNRLLQEYNSRDLSSAGQAFFCTKVKIFVLGYLLTVLLAEKNKSAGRKKAAAMMALLEKSMPHAHEMAVRQYRIFRIMNRFHISKRTWDRILDSKLYHAWKGNHDFS